MEAFPRVLERVPEARLIVAGANHHTRAGYWESIREAQPEHLPIEFRGYVPEDDIPELFQSTSVLVLPYDSATGSSGPAHQACEYGVPIVSADLPDFRGMAADEDMAIRFYDRGNADDLADQLLAILESPELERQMAEHNFAAGVEMTMTNVVNNYLRWFRLNTCKRRIRGAGVIPSAGRQELQRPRAVPTQWGLEPALIVESNDALDAVQGLEPARNYTEMSDYSDRFSARNPTRPKMRR
jgi:glycosyltransferase involved in cell wall biosynthesis